MLELLPNVVAVVQNGLLKEKAPAQAVRIRSFALDVVMAGVANVDGVPLVEAPPAVPSVTIGLALPVYSNIDSAVAPLVLIVTLVSVPAANL